MLSYELPATNYGPKTIYFLVGPTAVGKSEIAVYLAKKINAEIISCDSMQIYKGMGIVTSWPSMALQKNIRHHLIGLVALDKEYNVSKYRREALKKVKEIIKKGKIPLFVGGTGLYMSILVDGIFKSRTENKTLRRRLYKDAERFGSRYLHDKLTKVDPDAAVKIHPNDTKRIIRALEVFESTGRPISLLQKERSGLADEYRVKMFCLNMPKDNLCERIGDRVDLMFRQGLIREVKALLKHKLSKTASRAIGIPEIRGYLDGVYDLAKAKQLLKRNTCWYAKRQLTWFRKDKRINWIEIDDKDKPKEIAERIWKKHYLLQ